ncbi:MAG TPA: hypothetical protein VK428_16130 [Acidimicrobiales bacterium]|nr:hypothetical protein [Acidimicrobiales bacterium]
MSSLFSSLSVPQLSTLSRRSALVAGILGVVAVIVSLVVGHGLFGIGMAMGLGLAMANFRLVARSAAKAATSGRQGRPLVGNTLLRLAVMSAVCLVLAWLVGPLGFGAIVGLALFQFTLLASVFMILLREPAMGESPGE